MASTNKTVNLLLSQFLGTDHFSFLTDYNGDMLKIDTYYGNLKALIDGQASKTEGNTESIQDIQSDIQSIQSVQERQNTNITNNTTDITSLKSDDLVNKANIEKNTKDIELLKEGSGKRKYLSTSWTSQKPNNLDPDIYYDPQTKGLCISSNQYEWGIGSTNKQLGFVGTLDVSSLPTDIKNRLLSLPQIKTFCGFIHGVITQILDGETVPFHYTMPIVLTVGGTSDHINANISITLDTAATGGIPNLTNERDNQITTALISGFIPLNAYIQ